MNILVSGGTGFVGRALVLRLRRDGHDVTVLARDAARAGSLLGTEARIVSTNAPDVLAAEVERAHAVISLAGEPVIGRWTTRRRESIRKSRTDSTRKLVEAIGKAATPPKVFVSASAVGYYGDGGDRVLTEESPIGSGFLADVCQDWEFEARKAESGATRVAIFRIGVVLGLGGGALEPMLPLFRAGVGGPIGSGRQYVSWIHLEDLVGMMATAIMDARYSGTFNATGPEPVTFKAFAKALGRALHRPAMVPAPSFAIRAVFGEAASVLLEGQRALPEKTLELGFRHRFTTVDAALGDLFSGDSVHIGPIEGPIPQSAYLEKRRPIYLLHTETVLDRSIEEVFHVFSRPENLGLITPPGMSFRVTSAPDRIVEGAHIEYRMRIRGIPIRWTTRIDAWEDGARFVDSQLQGPYSSWWHEHNFRAEGDRTVMTDRVYYAPPLGPLGRIANALFITSELKGVFGYRAAIMRLRFGG